jgi:hypothetical protein
VEQAHRAVRQIEQHMRLRAWPVLPPGQGRAWLERP